MGYIIIRRPMAVILVSLGKRRRGGQLHTDRDGDTDELPTPQRGASPRDEVTEDDANGHGEKDPDGQESVEE